MNEIQVAPHVDTKVGDYVPFYFCPRSVMLFILARGNHQDLQYRGGQDPIVHLEADLRETVAGADAEGVRWAFSHSNAGARYVEFRSRLAEMAILDWHAIAATDFRDSQVKEAKQAEFLLHGFFPIQLVERIGVRSLATRDKALAGIQKLADAPRVDLKPEWYF